MRFRKIAAALLTLALGFCLCQPAAFAATAADQHTQLQELPVSIQSTGETPLPKETLTVELEAVDNAPLPQVTTLEITDGETGSFGPIDYTKPGYYVYTVRQRAGVNTRGTYDETVYYLRVSVVWDNDKLVARMAVHTQADLMDEKVSSITFNNSYADNATVLNSELYRASLKISECVSHESSKVIIYIIAIPFSSSASTGKECTSRSGRNPVRIAVAISSSRCTNSNTNRKCRTICRTLKSLLSSIHLSQPGSSLGLNLRCGCVGRCYSGILNYTDHGRNENSSKYADDSDYYYELYECKALLGLESLKLLYHCKDLL